MNIKNKKKGIWLHLLQRSRISMQSQLSHVNWKYLNYHCDMIAIVLFVLDVVIIAKIKQTWSLLLLLLLKETKKTGHYCKWSSKEEERPLCPCSRVSHIRVTFSKSLCFRQGWIHATLRNKKNIGLICFMLVSSSDFGLLCCTIMLS